MDLKEQFERAVPGQAQGDGEKHFDLQHTFIGKIVVLDNQQSFINKKAPLSRNFSIYLSSTMDYRLLTVDYLNSDSEPNF